MEVHNNSAENWKVTLLDTGLHTMTGGRIKRAQNYVGNEPFMVTYGDGVSNVDITSLVNFHKNHGNLMTMTAVQPEGRYGSLEFGEDGDSVKSFLEKPKGDGGWINGGFFVCQPEVFDYIDGDQTIFERDPIENVAKDGGLMSFKHEGFWQCMDTLRDNTKLEEFWQSGAPWKTW